MAKPARRPCRNPKCGGFTVGEGQCSICGGTTLRGNSGERGYTAEWQRARRWYLARNPQCTQCGGAATVVDHITPHRGDIKLFWDQANWQPLCAKCHNIKSGLGL